MEFLKAHKYSAAFISALLLQVWFDACAYAANHSTYLLAIGANLTYPFISMVPIILMIEEDGLRNKAKVGVATGIGYATGTVLFLAGRDWLLGGAL